LSTDAASTNVGRGWTWRGLTGNMSKPTANWEKVGDRFYRKIQLYTGVFDDELELDKYRVVGAPYSGAVGR
jgi:hypothetical protein